MSTIYNGVPAYTTLNISQISYGSIHSISGNGTSGNIYPYTTSRTYTSPGGSYTINLNNTTIGASNYGYTYINQTSDVNWLNPLQHTITIDEEIKYVSKIEAEEIIKKYLILEKMCDEFPQVKYERDKLESLIKLHTDDESNEK